MEILQVNALPGSRRETLNGREYIVRNMVLIVPGVLPGSQGAYLYKPEVVSRRVETWNGMPLVGYHPRSMGKHTTARDPKVLNSQGLGTVFHAHYDGQLKAEGWFDVENVTRFDRTLSADAKLMPRLLGTSQIELSTGLFTIRNQRKGKHSDGRDYIGEIEDMEPDHVAILPDQQGACSVKDGCGVLANQVVWHDGTDWQAKTPCKLSRFLAILANCGGKGGKPGPCKGGGKGKAAKPTLATVQAKIKKARKSLKELKKHPEVVKLRDGRKAKAEPAATSVDKPGPGNGLPAATPAFKKKISLRYGKGGLQKIANEAAMCDCAKCKKKTKVKKLLNRMFTANEADVPAPVPVPTVEVDVNKSQTISWLTANCDCWKGQDKALENFDEAQLKKLKADAETTQTLLANAKNPVQLTMEQLPPELLAVFNAAKADAKAPLIAQLTENVADADKDAMKAIYNKMDISDLTVLAEKLPKTVVIKRTPLFVGNGAGDKPAQTVSPASLKPLTRPRPYKDAAFAKKFGVA